MSRVKSKGLPREIKWHEFWEIEIPKEASDEVFRDGRS